MKARSEKQGSAGRAAERAPAERIDSRRGVKDVMETVMKAVFVVCGLVAVGFVLIISIYLIISGLPAIREVGLWNFLAGTNWDPRQQERQRRIRHPAHDFHQHLRHLRRHLDRRAHRLPHGRVPQQGGRQAGRRRDTRGGGPAGRHPQRGLRPGGHDGAAAPSSARASTSRRATRSSPPSSCWP